MANAHSIEIALLLLVAFVLGCFAGYWLNQLFKVPAREPEIGSNDAGRPLKARAAVNGPKAGDKKASPPGSGAVEGSGAPSRRKAVENPPAGAPPKKPASTKAQRSTDKPARTATPQPSRPKGLAAPRAGKKDDLKQIKGIGPKIEGQLNELGVFHFDQIAAWDEGTVDWVNGFLSFKGRIERERWIAQAQSKFDTA